MAIPSISRKDAFSLIAQIDEHLRSLIEYETRISGDPTNFAEIAEYAEVGFRLQHCTLVSQNLSTKGELLKHAEVVKLRRFLTSQEKKSFLRECAAYHSLKRMVSDPPTELLKPPE